MIKNRWTYRLIEQLAPDFSSCCAEAQSKELSKISCGDPIYPPSEFKNFAHQKFLEGFEMVILGHSHFPEEVEEWMDGKRCLYFNVGDWMVHRSFLRFTPPDRFELGRFGDR